MKLTIKRLDRNGRYETMIKRDDGVSFHTNGVAHTFAIPHDLAHFLVEKALGLDQGFWASVADGAVFQSMSHAGGRRKPNAAKRSKAVLKANARALTEAEVLVRIFNDTIEQGHAEDSPLLQKRLRERLKRPGLEFRVFSAAEISKIYTAYKDMLSKWRELPVGGRLDLRW